MDDDGPDRLTIGQLASDQGAVPPAGRSAGGYRLYDAAGVARVELVRTLRELGLGLDDVRRVLDGGATVAEVAEAHVAALDAQIRFLKVSRAVLSTVSKRGSTAEETALMNRLARLSAAERTQIINDFQAEVFGHLDQVRDLRIDLPDDPSPEQVDAWIELAELLQDPDFRSRMRVFLELNTPVPGRPEPPSARVWWARQVLETVARARNDGIQPDRPEAAALVAELFGTDDRAAVLAGVEAGIEAGAERYRRLASVVRGRRGFPDATADLQWLVTVLRRSGPR
jgi:DNA-binding transcriptional MerR regulator